MNSRDLRKKLSRKNTPRFEKTFYTVKIHDFREILAKLFIPEKIDDSRKNYAKIFISKKYTSLATIVKN